MHKCVLLCGVGGQGTVPASKLLQAAAEAKGIGVLSAETIGMAQRGGSVFSHLKMGDDIYSPLIGRSEADIILGFEPGETVRMLPYLRKDGVVIVSKRPVMPVTAALMGSDYNGDAMIDYLKSKVDKVIVVDTDKAIEDLGSAKVLNIVLLGAALESGALDITKDEIKEVIKKRVKPQFVELNMRAIDYIKKE